MSDFLDRAVQSHVQWKLKLLAAVSEGDPIDRSAAGVDDMCDLGKWIYGEGASLRGLPEFRDLQAKHKEFHDAVCAVADLIAAGRLDKAKHEIAHGRYKHASTETVDAIRRVIALRVVA